MTSQFRQTRIEIIADHRNVADRISFDLAGPANDQGLADSGFVKVTLGAPQRLQSFGITEHPVVPKKNDEGFLSQSEFIQPGNQSTDTRVESFQHGSQDRSVVTVVGSGLF